MTRGISINRFTLSSPNDCGRKIVLPRGGLLCWGEALGWRVYGYLLFIKINSTLAYQGQELMVTPPERVRFDANPVGPLVVTNTGGAPDLKLSVPSAPAATVLVLATRPRSAGVSFAKHFAILGVLPATEAGYSNITDLYVARYGVPPAGTRIFIRTRQVLNGWEDVPKQTTAIVPRL